MANLTIRLQTGNEREYEVVDLEYLWPSRKRRLSLRSWRTKNPKSNPGDGLLAYVCALVIWAKDGLSQRPPRRLLKTEPPGDSIFEAHYKYVGWRDGVIGCWADEKDHPIRRTKAQPAGVDLLLHILRPNEIELFVDERLIIDPSELTNIISNLQTVVESGHLRIIIKLDETKTVRIELTDPWKSLSETDRENVLDVIRLLQKKFPGYMIVCDALMSGSTKYYVRILRPDSLPMSDEDIRAISLMVDPSEFSASGIGVSPDDDAAPVTLVVRPNETPSDAEIYRYLSFNFRRHEPRSIVGRIKESLSLLWSVLTVPQRGLTTALSRFHFIANPLAAMRNRAQKEEPALQRATQRGLFNALLTWPFLTLLVAMFFAVPILGQSSAAAYAAVGCNAVLLPVAASLVCALVFNILGVGAGSVCFGLAFALVQALLIRSYGTVDALANAAKGADPFVAVVTGIIGASAAGIQSAAMKVAVLVPPALAIGAAAVLMGRPRSDEPAQPPSDSRILLGTLVGIFGGIGIGAIAGLTMLFQSLIGNDALAFSLPAAFVGGICFGFCVWLRLNQTPRRQRIRRSVICGIGYAALGAVLWFCTIATLGTPLGLYLAAPATGLFHSCFFTLSYTIGFRIAGRRGGAIAATVEGVGGFVIANAFLLNPSNILWVLIAALAVVWIGLGVWIAVCLSSSAAKSAEPETTDHAINSRIDAFVHRLSNLVPPLAIISSAGAVFALGSPAPDPAPVAARAVHYFGIVVLFVFLVIGTFCQFESWSKVRRSASLQSLVRTYRRWWIATKLLPAPAAICILIGGLALIYAAPANGLLTVGWTFWLIVSFTCMFVDGLTFYLPEICYRYATVKDSQEAGLTTLEYRRLYRAPWKELMLLLHAVSFPFVFSLGAAKPQAVSAPSGFAGWLYGWFGSGNFDVMRVGGAVLLFILVGIAVLLCRGYELSRYLKALSRLAREEDSGVPDGTKQS